MSELLSITGNTRSAAAEEVVIVYVCVSNKLAHRRHLLSVKVLQFNDRFDLIHQEGPFSIHLQGLCTQATCYGDDDVSWLHRGTKGKKDVIYCGDNTGAKYATTHDGFNA